MGPLEASILSTPSVPAIAVPAHEQLAVATRESNVVHAREELFGAVDAPRR